MWVLLVSDYDVSETSHCKSLYSRQVLASVNMFSAPALKYIDIDNSWDVCWQTERQKKEHIVHCCLHVMKKRCLSKKSPPNNTRSSLFVGAHTLKSDYQVSSFWPCKHKHVDLQQKNLKISSCDRWIRLAGSSNQISSLVKTLAILWFL